jgi:hypothetical protein
MLCICSGQPRVLKVWFLKMTAATKGSKLEFYKNRLKSEDLQRIAGAAAPELANGRSKCIK